MKSLSQNIRFSFRMMSKNPGFTLSQSSLSLSALGEHSHL